MGGGALSQNGIGQFNTGVGAGVGFSNLKGSSNTFLGQDADVGTDGLTFATAIGASAMVNESNALVLGGTGANAVKVGIAQPTLHPRWTCRAPATSPG